MPRPGYHHGLLGGHRSNHGWTRKTHRWPIYTARQQGDQAQDRLARELIDQFAAVNRSDALRPHLSESANQSPGVSNLHIHAGYLLFRLERPEDGLAQLADCIDMPGRIPTESGADTWTTRRQLSLYLTDVERTATRIH